LASFPVIGSNQGALAEGIWRSVIRINEGADGTIVMREFAQDNLKRAISEGRTTMDFVRQQLNDVLPQIDSNRIKRQLRTETDTDVIEAFSDVAVAYFRGSIREEQIPAGLRGIMRRLAIISRDIFRRAYNLARLRAEGKLDRDFEALLAEAVGVNQQALVDRARERTEQEVGAGQNYSISLVGQYVKAKRAIEDSPLAEQDGSVKRGAVGYVDDYDSSSNLLYVDFGNGAIAVDPNEVTVTANPNYSIAVTPQQDTDYLAAVERGDMETAQRMVDEAGGWVGMVGADPRVSEDPESLWKEYETKNYGGKYSSDYMDIFETKNGGFALSMSKTYPYVEWSRSTAAGRGRTAYLELLYAAKTVGKKGVETQSFAESKAIGAWKSLERRGFISLKESSTEDRGEDGVYTVFEATILPKGEAFIRGETDPVTYDASGNVIPLSQRFDATTADINYSIVRSVDYLKNDTRFDKLVKDGRVFTGVDVNDFIDQHILLHSPDNAFAGTIQLTDGEQIDGKGGVYYPVLYADKNYFWASTAAMVMRTATHLNEIAAKNGGRVLMGLVSAPVEKLFSSTSMSAGVVKFLNALTTDPRAGLSKDDLNAMLVAASKVEVVVQTKTKTTKKIFSTKLKASDSYAKNLAKIDELLAPDGSIFQVRKAFVESLADQISKHLNTTPATADYVAGILADAENKHAKSAIKRGKLSKASFLQGLGNMLTEPFLRDFQEHGNGKIYAIVEVQGEVKGIATTEHESYPATIVPVNKKSKVKLHVLKEAVDWQDVVGKETGQYATPQERLNLLPTSGMSATSLKVLGVKAGSSAAPLNYSIASKNSLRVRMTRQAMTDAALAQESWKDWYEEHQAVLDEFFGDHAQLFQDILSITSQAASVKANVGLALRAFGLYVRGEPFDGMLRGQEKRGFLPAVIKNLERHRENDQLQGQKIRAYKASNDGEVDQAVVDRHIAQLIFGVKSPSKAQFAKAQKILSEIANEIGWTPRQVQAALWAHSIYKSGKTPQSYGDYLKQLESRGTIEQRIGDLGRRGPSGDADGGGRGRYAPDGAAEGAGVSNYSILARYEGTPSVAVEGGRPYSPIVRDLLQRRAAGEDIPREVIDQAINENFPAQLVEVPRSVAELPDRSTIDDAIDKGQRDKRIDVSTIEAGEKVAIRQDVPAMTRKGVGVVTVKSKAGNSYEAAVRITEPDFILNEKKSLRIAMGEAKGPHIVINGKWAADQSMPADLETWTQVGYNPDRHSFYYDRATMQQVTGGSEAYQIGNTVFVKDAQYGDGQISDISYSISTQSEIDRVQKAMGALDRSPLSRLKVYEKMQERFLRVMSDNRETLAAMEGGDLSQVRRTQILQALGELDGIISALPTEIRAKIGGYTQLAKVDPMDVFKGDQKVSEVRGMSGAIISAWMREGLNIGQAQKKTELPAGYRAERNLDPTRADRAIADVFIQRINRINEALEKFLRDEYNDAAVELFKRAKPQRSGAGEKPKGKLGATVHELFDTLKEATEWSAEKAQAWADGQWARIESGELNPYEQAHATLAAQVVPLFADWANADSTQRAAAVSMGKDILDRAYKGEQQRIIAQRTKRGYDRTDLSKDAGVSAEDDKARQNAVKRENSLPAKWEAAMLNLLNFDQVLRYVFGNDSKIAQKISDRQRKADNVKSDDIAALSDDWASLLTRLGGGEMQGQQLLFDLSRMDEEIDGVSYSQNQLVAITMMWMQPKGRQHMEGFMDSDGQPAGKWHYNQAFVNKAEKLCAQSPRSSANISCSNTTKNTRPSTRSTGRSTG
jgi:hypothetical protein